MTQTTRLGLYGGPRAPYSRGPGVASATITAIGITDDEIVAGGQTAVIDLTNDTWVASGATFNAQRQAIIDGITSAQIEATGWNAEVRDKEVVTAVVRTSDTKVTITLTASAAYDITATETITATIPAAALTAAGELVATPNFVVQQASGDDRWDHTRGMTQTCCFAIVRDLAA
jgi:hypothetical protein